MLYRALARTLAAVHITYVVFVVAGSLLVLRWPSLVWAHVACILWAFATMTTDLGCRLTTWEKSLWRRGGVEPYPEGFLQHHVLHTVFPAEESRVAHIKLGVAVVVLNLAVYAYMHFMR